jgi:hypothetical protein
VAQLDFTDPCRSSKLRQILESSSARKVIKPGTREFRLTIAFCAFVLLLSANAADTEIGITAESHKVVGPLRVSGSNPRYFTDANDQIVYLTGSHTWDNLIDRSTKPDFSYMSYLNFLQAHNHNFIRLWTREAVGQDSMGFVDMYPLPYQRTGPGNAIDGKLKFDLTKFNPAYFRRLRSRVQEAHDRGIYVMVTLFNGFSVHLKRGTTVSDHPRRPSVVRRNPWPGHFFNGMNNINGIDGDANGNGEGEETHTLKIAAVTRLQEAYVRKVIDTVNDLDVLYEISNESHRGSVEWQYHMIRFIHQYEKTKRKQNPVVMTAMWDGSGDPGEDNSALFASPAEAISPGSGTRNEYKNNPPSSSQNKVIVSDTDHLWGTGGNVDWVWKTFLRGLNPIFMDPLDNPQFAPIQKAMGQTAVLARRINLGKMAPRQDLASSGFCLADPGSEYLVYLPSDSHWLESGLRQWIEVAPFVWRYAWLAEYIRPLVSHLSVDVDISANVSTKLRVTWFNPSTEQYISAGEIGGGHRTSFTAPFSGPALLHLTSVTIKTESRTK